MLLLTGPPGCGKTATLHALSRDMGFTVVEWVNPESEGRGRGVQEEGERGSSCNVAIVTSGQGVKLAKQEK